MKKAKKSFYDILWLMVEKENLITKWIMDDYLSKSKDTFFWTPKTLNLFDSEIIGEKIIEVPLKKPELSEYKLESKVKSPIDEFPHEQNKLEEFINLFNRKNIGLAGKTTPKITVVKKLIKFFKDYPDYNMDDVVEGTKLYIANLKKQGSIRFIRECGYFISKKIDGVDQSDLAKWCQEHKDGGQNYTDYTSHNLL